MAKKLNVLSGHLEDQGIDLADLDRGIIRSTGVGLREGEIDALERIATEYGVARNALIRYAVRHFLEDYQAGRISLAVDEPPPPKKKLKLPGQE